MGNFQMEFRTKHTPQHLDQTNMGVWRFCTEISPVFRRCLTRNFRISPDFVPLYSDRRSTLSFNKKHNFILNNYGDIRQALKFSEINRHKVWIVRSSQADDFQFLIQ
eukprot:TRINITY_DN2805_c0_g1_i9.p1 TRINITY_DN2805_c0_g1~~TRINITY_DN2805_c0_g1_i9.p1  ORF type:complete len:107 (+),score=2.40 TRINITY_DN2805_c0_g1_i9:173-493(+)